MISLDQLTSVALAILVVLVIMMVKSHFAQSENKNEGLTGCTYCDSYTIPDGPMIKLNPFVWPYSGTSCPDDIRILEKDRGVNPNAHIPLVSYSVADHAAQTA
jgi:hypothetical protein